MKRHESWRKEVVASEVDVKKNEDHAKKQVNNTTYISAFSEELMKLSLAITFSQVLRLWSSGFGLSSV
jgi:hypothetical protein